jgi:imidazolonepropionase-like amidohydrolase
MSRLILTNARLIDGTGEDPREGVTVVVEDGRIASVREDASGVQRKDDQVVDLEGRTLLPGLINAHMHIMLDASADPTTVAMEEGVEESVLKGYGRGEQMLRAGITTARDLGGFEYGEITLRDAFASGDAPGPRLLCAGKLITSIRGHGWMIGSEVDGPDQVRAAARENLEHGVDCIKLMATGGVMTEGVVPGEIHLTEDELRAGVEVAHEAGLRTATHAQGTEGIKNALRAGIDTVEHGIYLDEEAIEMMVRRGVVFVPTLAAPYRIAEAGEAKGVPAFAVQKSLQVMDTHRRSFERAVAAGVTIAAGNDGGTPFNPAHDLVTEVRLMVEYGMSPMAAIAAATRGSALALGLSEETGSIQPGKWADCLVLESGADPLADITALGRVWMVVKQGKVALSAER